MTNRELRIVAIQVDGLAHYDVRYWRRRGPLFVPEKRYVVIDGRDLDALVHGLWQVQRAMAALGRR